MKSEMPFLGVRVPAVRALTRKAAKGEADRDVLIDTALTLWREAEFREERYAALALMALPPLRADATLLWVHELMIRTGAWWDLVDEVAHRLSEIFDADPRLMAVQMRVWSGDDDLWIRRAAIISQLGRGLATDREALAHAIVENVDDREFFIRKAIGWALRDLAKQDPEWVREFALRHPQLSPLSRREALRNLK